MSDDVPDFMRAAGVSVLAPADPDAQPDAEPVAGEFIAAGDDAPLPPPPPFVPGIFDGMAAAHYHAVEAMSSGGAKKMRRSPAHYKLMRTTRNVPTAAMQFGTGIHAGVLEPHTFGNVVVVAPDFNKRSNAGKADAAEFAKANAGRVIVNRADFDRMRRCIDAVRAHPAARQLLDGATIERSLFWNDARYGVPCKARWDAWNHSILVDLKSCEDASPEGFARAIARYEYHAQAALYCSAAEHILDASPQAFVFIAVETEPPHAVACYALPGAAIAAGMHLTNIALARYAEALQLGEYRGYPDTIEAIQIPKWAMRFA